MSNVASSSAASEKINTPTPSKETTQQGVLKGESGKTHSVFAYQETEAMTAGVSEFLANSQETLTFAPFPFVAVPITPEELGQFIEIQALSEALEQNDSNETSLQKQSSSGMPLAKSRLSQSSETTGRSSSSSSKATTPRLAVPQTHRESTSTRPTYSSLFSLAKAVNQTRALQRNGKEEGNSKDSTSHRAAAQQTTKESTQTPLREQKQDKEKEEGKRDQQGQQHHQEQEESQKRSWTSPTDKKKKRAGFERISAASSPSKENRASPRAQAGDGSSEGGRKANGPVEGVESIFIRFMALMARILGQAEAEAHDLYQRIKHRTDDVDTLTLLLSKINSNSGKIDWSKNEEMKQLLERARSLGVDIPAGKYTWTEEEKKVLKENIQMRKDSMEKITQLERTDMQRYLQEASQCHQARSNILKLLKEVTDLIVSNMRP